jgi:opacity protein-like surface antigen
MQRSQATTLAVLAAGLFAAASAVQAQAQGGQGQGQALGAQTNAMVSVDLSKVAPSIATNIKVDASAVPLSVQAPVGVAANVCGVSASTLAQQTGGASCQATSTNAALDQVVQKQMKK